MDTYNNIGKRKVEVITLNSKKKIKRDKLWSKCPISDYMNYKLLEGEEESTPINNSITKYIKLFFQKVKSSANHKFIEQLILILNQLRVSNPQVIKQLFFKNLFDAFIEDISARDDIKTILEFHSDLMKELKRISLSATSKKHNLDPQKVLIKIKNIDKALKQIVYNIQEAEKKELCLEDLETPNEYTHLPMLYKAAIRNWKLREKLLNRSINTGLYLYGKFNYNGTENELINRIISTYFTNYLILLKENEENIVKGSNKGKNIKKNWPNFGFFTIIDLKNELTKEISNQQIEFDLNDLILEKIYKDLTMEMKKRRLSMQFESLRSLEFLPHITPELMVDENDPEINQKLKNNEIEGIKTLENLIEEYKKKDYSLNGGHNTEDKSIGWDDGEDEDEDDDEDEEHEDGSDESENENENKEDNDKQFGF